MDEAEAIVELDALRDVDAEDMTRRIGVLNLADVGIDDDITRARIVTFNVFCGSHYGSVPVLRLSTAYDRGHGLCLSQVVDGSRRFPVMGDTAWVSPMSPELLENEKEIALNAFLYAMVA
jgi:hypothetical protein